MPLPNSAQPYDTVCVELNQLRRNLGELATEWEHKATDTDDAALAGYADELRWKLSLSVSFPRDPNHPDYQWRAASVTQP